VTVDWELYQKCPVCKTLLGDPCMDRSASEGVGQVDRATPHSPRKLRAAAARAVGRG
jgi:hypothetical protein